MEPDDQSKAYSTAFSGELANVLFGTPADPDRDAAEVEIVNRIEKWINTASKKRIWTVALFIDDTLIPLLSGKNLLHVARLIEDRADAVITQMRRLRSYREHLEKAAEMAEILSEKNMNRLTAALSKSASNDSSTGSARED